MIQGASLPPELSPPLQALWWLRQGEFKLGRCWDTAHEICQQAEGTRGHDLVHALTHWIEGDTANRDYWYRRVKPWARAETLELEWQRMWDELS